MTKIYEVKQVITKRIELTYSIEADSKVEAKREIEDGGYTPDNEEELSEKSKIVSIELIAY